MDNLHLDISTPSDSSSSLSTYRDFLFPSSLRSCFPESDFSLDTPEKWAKSEPLALFLDRQNWQIDSPSSYDVLGNATLEQMQSYRRFLLPTTLAENSFFSLDNATKWCHENHFQAYLASPYCSPLIRFSGAALHSHSDSPLFPPINDQDTSWITKHQPTKTFLSDYGELFDDKPSPFDLSPIPFDFDADAAMTALEDLVLEKNVMGLDQKALSELTAYLKSYKNEVD